MRRLVYATKIDELRSAKEQYDAELNALADKHHESEQNWRTAMRLEAKELEQEILDRIGPFDIDLEITADSRWRNGVEVNISARGSKSLRWNMTITLNDDGSISKKSNSWSGLEATTLEQVEDLKESVRVIERINKLDWSSILHPSQVEYDAFFDPETSNNYYDKKRNRPNFEGDILNAEIEELIGTNKWIKLHGSPVAGYGTPERGTFWAKIQSETPVFYVISIVYDYLKDSVLEKPDSYSYPMKVKKSKFIEHIASPIEFFEEGVSQE